ncbi:hypothetical protein [Mucilaginibacter gynuensis]|uniref:hypothetical protein n=1 Tax=Mucilaginibacter gynuensis TaxID=1302236 RepID=UPI0031E54E79
MKTAIHIGVVITENIKNFVESPAADMITLLIPGDIDDALKAWLRKRLPAILAQLKLTEIHEGDDQILKNAIENIQILNGDAKNAFLHNIAVLIGQAASYGKLSWTDGVYFTEWYYNKVYKETLNKNTN